MNSFSWRLSCTSNRKIKSLPCLWVFMSSFVHLDLPPFPTPTHKGELMCIGSEQKKNDKRQKLCCCRIKFQAEFLHTLSFLWKCSVVLAFTVSARLIVSACSFSFFSENISLRDIWKSKGKVGLKFNRKWTVVLLQY